MVGYDDIALAAHFHPPLTTVRQPIEAAGRALVDALLSQIGGEKPHSTLLVTELVQRETTRATPAPRTTGAAGLNTSPALQPAS